MKDNVTNYEFIDEELNVVSAFTEYIDAYIEMERLLNSKIRSMSNELIEDSKLKQIIIRDFGHATLKLRITIERR